jgi:hypothetical protein
MSFSEIADQRLLGSVAGHLGELTWEVDPGGYQRLRVDSTAEVDVLLRLLRRRGLDPALASLLLDRFESRPDRVRRRHRRLRHAGGLRDVAERWCGGRADPE